MRRKIVAIAAGLVVLLSAVLLAGWVNRAEQRALAAQQPVTVLVATAEIPAGTAAANAASLVTGKQIPAAAVVPGALTTLDSVAGKVAMTAIHAGEQIIAMRWGATVDSGTNQVQIPNGYQSVSFQLSPDRLNGGKVAPGNRIGIFITDTIVATATPGAGEPAEKATKLVLAQVLVLDVVGGVGTDPNTGGSANPVPTQMIMVTVALTGVQAEKLIWGLEGAKVYISLQNEKTDTQVPVAPITGDDVFHR